MDSTKCGIHEQRAVWGHDFLAEDSRACVLGEVLGEHVVTVAYRGRAQSGGADAFAQVRIPLFGLAADEAIVVVEALVRRSVIECPRGRRLGIEDEVPLAVLGIDPV